MRRWLRVLAFTAAVAVASAGALLCRLSRGPISLDFLTPYVVRALEPSDRSFLVSIGATELVWTGRWNDVDLRARDVSCTSAAGATIAKLPSIAIELSVRALLRGEIAPSQLELVGPELRLVREPDGSLGLGLAGGQEDAGDGGAPLLEKLLAGGAEAEPGDAPAAAWLRRIDVRSGELSIVDRGTGFEAQARAVDFRLERKGDALTVRLAADLALGGERIPISLNATRALPAGDFRVVLQFRHVDPAATVQATSALQPAPGSVADAVIEAAARIGLALDGTLTLDLGPDAALRSLEIDATGAEGALDLPPPLPARVRLERLSLDAKLDLAADTAELRHLEVDLGRPEVRLSGSWSGGARGALAAEATVQDLPVDALAGYWPADAAAEARDWVTSNVTAGVMPQATVSVRGELPASEPGAFTLLGLSGRLSFAGLAVRYVDTMPEATGVGGSATFSPDAWSLRVDSARVAGLAVPGATVAVTALSSDAPQIAIDARARGPLRDALALVDHEPLRYAHAIGIDPANASGTVSGRVELAFPLAGPAPSDLGARVHAELRDAALPHVVDEWPLSDGNLTLDVDGGVLDVAGTGKLAGVALTVQWEEHLEARSGVTRRVRASGDVDAAGRTALGFDLQPWLTGTTPLHAQIDQRHDGTGTATIAADLTPAKLEVEELRVAKEPGEPGRFAATLALAGSDVKSVDPFSLEAGGASAHGRATFERSMEVEHLQIDGALPAAARGGQQPRFSLTLTPAAKGSRFQLTSDDASTLLQVLIPDAETAGGKLRFTGTVDESAPGFPFSGDLAVKSFALTDSTVLARIATLASLSGIVSALKHEGIAFESLTAGIDWNASAVTFKDGVVDGKSLRLVFSGSIDERADRVAMQGTLVPPLYGLNAVPGKVPILGSLLGGSDGGFIAIDFTVEGTTRDPKVSVKPLSSLAPGVLRSLVRKVPW